MPDKFDSAKRSYIMSRIRGKDTQPECIVFSYLRKNNVYFQKHYKRATGSPDIALPRKKKAVFIDGDFWHGYELERRKDNLPPYWLNKIIKNVKCDKRNRMTLRADGWQVMRVWEHELSKQSRDTTLENIYQFLNQP